MPARCTRAPRTLDARTLHALYLSSARVHALRARCPHLARTLRARCTRFSRLTHGARTLNAQCPQSASFCARDPHLSRLQHADAARSLRARCVQAAPVLHTPFAFSAWAHALFVLDAPWCFLSVKELHKTPGGDVCARCPPPARTMRAPCTRAPAHARRTHVAHTLHPSPTHPVARRL